MRTNKLILMFLIKKHIRVNSSRARNNCRVLKRDMVTDKFNAELWLNTVAQVFKGSSAAPKGQDVSLMCNMKAKRVNKIYWDSLLEEALVSAKNYADAHF